MSDELLTWIIDDAANSAIKFQDQLNQYRKPKSLVESLGKFDSQKIEFKFKSISGKENSRNARVDEYTYFVATSLQKITQKDLSLLDRALELQGSISQVRR